ncbi:hypothetical protein [Aureimonas mangrovi]|uniref:hypothetical protein n=1 Tax=Aureimonas mangrovi TaxID=2758041 RepID=UPI00163DC880|nr:hypothetical protein [Aureimonas mangrovi]
MTTNPTVPATAGGMPDHAILTPFDQDEQARRHLTAYLETLDLSSLRKGLAFSACRMGTLMLKAEAMNALMDRDKEADQSMAVAVALSLATDLVAMNGAGPAAYVTLPAITGGREREIAYAYMQWLHMEKRLLSAQLWPGIRDADDAIPHNTEAQSFHFPDDRPWNEAPMPSTRAEIVLRFVGVDLDRRAA